MEAIKSLIGDAGRNINNFHIYNTQRIIIDNKTYEICVVMVDGLYKAFLVMDEIIISEIAYTRNIWNLYQILFEKTQIQEYDDMVEKQLEKETE